MQKLAWDSVLKGQHVHTEGMIMAQYVTLFSHHRTNGGPPEQPAGTADQHHRPAGQQDKTAPSLTATDRFTVLHRYIKTLCKNMFGTHSF